MRRTRVLVALLPVALALSACGGAKHAGSGGSPASPSTATSSTATSSAAPTPPAATTAAARPPATGQLTDLHSVAQLNSLFDGGAGEPRLVVLMSPT